MPASAQFVPNPAPGQDLVTGGPAPETFTEAWEQVVSVVDAELATLKAHYESPDDEFDLSLLRSAGVTLMPGQFNNVLIEDRVDDNVLTLVASFDDECTSGILDELTSCICQKCTISWASAIPSFIIHVGEHFTFRSTQDSIPVAQQAKKDAERYLVLTRIRALAFTSPWKILTSAPDDTTRADAAIAEARTKAREARRAFRKLEEAAQDERSLLNGQSKPYNHPNVSSNQELHLERRSIRAGYERYAAFLADGKSPLESGDHSSYIAYDAAQVTGPVRHALLAAGLAESAQKVKQRTEFVELLLTDLAERRAWGEGWPLGASNAPTPHEWTALNQTKETP